MHACPQLCGRGGDWLGVHERVQCAVHLPALRADVGIGREFADEAVVEAEGCEGAGCGRGEGGEVVHRYAKVTKDIYASLRCFS